MVHPDDVEVVRDAMRRASDPAGDGRYRADYRVRRPAGGWRWVSAWGLVEFEGEGENRHAATMTGASRDITARKQAELFSEAQKQSLELIVRGAPLREVLTHLARVVERQSDEQVVAAILFLDSEGRLRSGAAPSLPVEYCDAIDGLKAEPHVGTCSAAAATSRVAVTPDIENDPGWAAIRHLPLQLGLRAAWSQPILARDGRVLGTFGTYFRTCREPSAAERDAVEVLAKTAALAIERARMDDALRETERKLREEDRRKNEFLAALSHEMRNPLAPLRTAIRLLQENDGGDARERLVKTMDRQVEQLVRLVDDLLEVSRISRGILQLREELLDMRNVVALAVETSQPLLEAAGHALSVELPEQPVWVHGDRARLAQILSNLLNNAAKYSDPGGRIAVNVRRHGTNVSVSIRDTGIGLDPQAIAGLFELFARGESSERRHSDGLGIGLALAQRLARLHGGSVTGVSDGPGTGAEFTLHLPIATSAMSAARDAEDSISPDDRPLAARVLVVDDNRDAADMTAELLTTLGCETRSVYDGDSAVSAAEQMQPDVILLDIGLPDVNGYDVCRRIRQEAWGSETTIVALTGWGQAQDRLESDAAGFNAHLVKPVAADSLIALLKSLP